MFTNLSWVKYTAPFLAGLLVMWLYHSATISGIEEDVAKKEAFDAQQSQLAAWVTQQRMQAIDEKYTKELSDAQEVSRRLSAELAAGSKRLSVRASCPALLAATSAGVGNGGIAILDRIAQQAYLDHRALIEKKDAQIKVLQQALKSPQ